MRFYAGEHIISIVNKSALKVTKPQSYLKECNELNATVNHFFYINNIEAQTLSKIYDSQLVKKVQVYLDNELLEVNVNGRKYYTPKSYDYYVYSIGNETYICTQDEIEMNSILLRVIREYMLRAEINNNSLLFHAASFSNEGNGYIILGPSGAGKTSMLAAFLTDNRNAFVCNDRTIIRRRSLSISGLPLPVRIGYGFLKNHYLTRNKRQYNYRLERYGRRKSISDMLNRELADDAFAVGNSKKIELTPKEFYSLYNSTIDAFCNLKAIIVPSINFSSNCIDIEKIDIHDVMDTLFSELRAPDDPLWPSTWLYSLKEKHVYNSNGLAALLGSVSFYKISFPADWKEADSKLMTDSLSHLE